MTAHWEKNTYAVTTVALGEVVAELVTSEVASVENPCVEVGREEKYDELWYMKVDEGGRGGRTKILKEGKVQEER
jgi:hypothetical protein